MSANGCQKRVSLLLIADRTAITLADCQVWRPGLDAMASGGRRALLPGRARSTRSVGGSSRPVAVAGGRAPRSRRRRPSRRVTWPNTVCLPSSQGALSVVTMKNCEPFVFGPALAMASAPRTTLWWLISSSNCVAGAAGAGALRAAALDHEVGDHAVEDDPVVEAVGGQLAEVRDRLRRVVVEQLERDRAVGGVHVGCAHACEPTRSGRERLRLASARAGARGPGPRCR